MPELDKETQKQTYGPHIQARGAWSKRGLVPRLGQARVASS